MSQKKKLVLSPLPEQTDDYSRYEESVTRWDRIIAVGVLLVLMIGILIYSLVGNNDPSIEANIQNDSHSIKPVPILDLEKKASSEPEKITKTGNEVAQMDAQNSTMGDHQDSSLTINAFKSDTQKPIEQHTEQEPSKEITKNGVVETTSVVQSKSVEADTQTPKLSILNNGISNAVLTLDLNDKDSAKSIPYVLVLPEEGIVKVMLFTEMNGLRGKTLFHEWYRNGIRQARVKIPVNINKQNSYSSKYINSQMLGEWQVKVVDQKAEPYILANFKVVLP